MKKHPLAWFYLLAFAISWLGWLPTVASSQRIIPFEHPVFQILLILPAIAPALAATLVTATNEGMGGVHRLFKLLFRWQIGVRWLAIAIFMPALFLLLGKIITKVLGWTATPELQSNNGIALTMATLVMSLLANPWEEVGWRGFALPHLQKRHNALVATLVVGILWGLWHLPLFFWVGNPMSNYPFLAWFLGTVAISFVYTWLYNSTNGSLLAVTLFHVLGNTFGVLLSGASIPALTIVYCAAAGLVIVLCGKDNLARHERVRAG